MKKVKKILSLGVATTILISSTSVMALPLNTVVLGTKAFSTRALLDGVGGIQSALDAANGRVYYGMEGMNNNGFVGLFNGQAMTQAQKDALKNIQYTNKVGDNVTTSTYLNFDDATPITTPVPTVPPTVAPTAAPTAIPTPTSQVLTVKSATALSATSIQVTFSNDATQTFPVSHLAEGSNTRDVVSGGITYIVTVNYTAPVVAAPTVEKVEFVNYRNIKVSFSNLVDRVSAADPNNYYFEMIDGNAEVFGALPTLRDSNQLSRIETNYPGGAAAWWNDAIKGNHIVAENVNGKTEVNIFLPEDARFTNVKDSESTVDAERTLGVEQQTSQTGPTTVKALIKNATVNVAVRNVKDTNGRFTINTAVKPINILDQVKPTLMEVKKVKVSGEETLASGNLSDNSDITGIFNLLRTLPYNNQVGDKVKLVYSEPVFDAHDLDMSDFENYRDVRLYVNGNLIASQSNHNLGQFMTFEMGAGATYAGSKTVILDVEAAALAAKVKYNETFMLNKNYNIRFVGVTDLAGNIEGVSDHSFIAKFHDDPIVAPNIVSPVVRDVVQVADNVFRIEFNRAGVEGQFKIKNPDGESSAELSISFKPSAQSLDSNSQVHYYSYVAVPARDNETNGSVPQGLQQNQVLAYDTMDTIFRDISVEEVRVEHDAVARDTLFGNPFAKNAIIVDDIKAPVAINPSEIAYQNRRTTISFAVKDMTPWVEDENITPWVSPIAYVYDSSTKRFENEIVANQGTADTYLPIKVSYTDAQGAVHQAMVSNYDLRPDAFATSINPGYPGSIIYDFDTNKLNLDLAQYPQLLGSNNKLIANRTYKIEIPSGYFTDSPLDINLQSNGNDFTFNHNGYDILNVDDGRTNVVYGWRRILEAGLGFTSTAQTLNVHVEAKPVPSPDLEAVPQTSLQLINYDEATKSMKIEFTGNIDVNSLKNRDNYSFNSKTLTAWDNLLGTNTVIEYVIDNSIPSDIHQYAVFKIPQDSIEEMGNYPFVVRGVKHTNGATMTTVETVVRLYDNYRPVVTNAVVTGDRQLKLTFKETVQYFVDRAVQPYSNSAARNFIVKVGAQIFTVTSAVLPMGATNNREITLDLGSVLPTTGVITVDIVKDQNGNILVIDNSTGKNPMKEFTYTVARP